MISPLLLSLTTPQGASVKELLIEACRRNNTDLLTETLAGRPDDEITSLLNTTTTVMGNHLYHEAASHGNCASSSSTHHPSNCQLTNQFLVDEIIDLLLDQPSFECDPQTRLDHDTPLHTAIRWINSEPPAQREFGAALVEMMLEAGSNPRLKNKGGLTPYQLVDPSNTALRELIQKHMYASQNAGDFIEVRSAPSGAPPPPPGSAAPPLPVQEDEFDEDAEFSGSDDEERAEWERRKKDALARR